MVMVPLLLISCGEKRIEQKPFEAAITEYLNENAYGMKVVSFKKIEVADDTATALCRMRDKEGTYSVSVTWLFTFEKKNDSWRTIKHARK